MKHYHHKGNKSTVPHLSARVTSSCFWLSVAENLAPRENSDLVNVCSLGENPDDASVTGLQSTSRFKHKEFLLKKLTKALDNASCTSVVSLF